MKVALAEQGRTRGPGTTIDHPLIRGLGTAGPDASWSCLGLEASVGGIRLLVVARVLQSGPHARFCSVSAFVIRSIAPPRWWGLASCQAAWQFFTSTCRAMAQTKPANSRAMAVVTTVAGLPALASRR